MAKKTTSKKANKKEKQEEADEVEENCGQEGGADKERG